MLFFAKTFKSNNFIIVLEQELKKNGWKELIYNKKKNLNYCSNDINSMIKNIDRSRNYFWSNKYYLYYLLKNKSYTLITYELINGNWLTKIPKEKDTIFFVKDAYKDADRGNILLKDIKSIENHSLKNKGLFVVQPNIDCLLYQKKKIDIRILGSLISKNHIDYDLCIYKKGLIRQCRKEYNTSDLQSSMHITTEAYHYNRNMVQNLFDDNFVYYDVMIKKIIDLCKDLMESTIHIFKNYSKYNNSIIWNIGFDFIFDKDFNIYLIEINHNPRYHKCLYKYFEFLAKNVYTSLAKNETIIYDKSIVIKI